ncbi:MAG: alpha/beta hydrolase [Actinomycetota bacterium]|nr:alpha/beta hydrolase [Actinomycetota bacterium]
MVDETLGGVSFTEEMKGYVAFGQTNFQDGLARGRADGTYLMFRLTIDTGDVDEFVSNPQHEGTATGYVFCERLGGRLPVQHGVFNLFVAGASLKTKQMFYRLFFEDAQGRPLTLSGFKNVQTTSVPEPWRDTTTLFTNILSGHVAASDEPDAEVLAAGILEIHLLDFMHQLTTFRASAPTAAERTRALERFGKLFLGDLWEVYGPSFSPRIDPYRREIPVYTTEGVHGAELSVHPFTTADKLGLSLLRFEREPCEDVVVIAHGLTTSSDMFIMPEHRNLVQFLLDNSFTDVWTLDYRMSNRHSYNLRRTRYNMDDIALYDFPAALKVVRDAVGPRARIHVIAHCLGSVSFAMALFGKTIDGVTSAICNSVALTPRTPSWSQVKLAVAPAMCDYVLGIEYLNPWWRRERGWSAGQVMSRVVSLFHRECNVPECHMLSFMWGSGHPALYLHENMADVTHRRAADLYGGVSVNYYRHVRKMVKANNTAVKFEPGNPKYRALPDDYFQYAKEIETPILFVTGELNRVFSDSNIVCHERLERIVPGRHSLHVFPKYGHQDVFMGKNVATDIFPRLLAFLEEHRAPRPVAARAS